ncbi:MAG: adenosylcobalamin-dependent ribonucleoside-diphosphate reductase [Desulfurococcales archaeon]|nr:adenosylcobalamin-dependent ribonucleoside-diphosphate reductase [Desulfurococcales archaeon]
MQLENIIVIKRDGREERFELEKLRKSIAKALEYADLLSYMDEVFEEIISELSELNKPKIKSTEIADRVERIFISKIVEEPKFERVASAYVLSRIYNDVFGKGKWEAFHEVDIKLSYFSLRVLQSRYLLKDPRTGRFTETPNQLFWRVAKHIASAEQADRDYWAKVYYEVLSDLRFVPNSPTLMNSGTKLGILSACFVLPVRDSMVTEDGEGIYDAVKAQAIIFQQGGGTGFDFSELRPEGDIVASTAGVASGPLSFMRIFDINTEVIKQGGRRRGANMGVLHIWHPDIRKFIKAKTGEFKDRYLQNFNISVGMYDYFMKALETGELVPLINPRKTSVDGSNDSRKYAIAWARHYIDDEWVQEILIDELEANGGSISLDKSKIITWDEALAIAKAEGAITEYVDPRELFKEMVHAAWEGGDPGLLFIDTINRGHPVWYLGKIKASNPCGEEPLLEWESCNLGSINLEKYVGEDGSIDWEGLARDVKIAVRFLDNVISVSKYPIKQLEVAAKRSRKIGLGVMGWAHMLIKLGIPYDSVDAVYLGYYIAEWIAYNAYLASIELAKEKGTFPAWDAKLYRPYWYTAMSLSDITKIAGIAEEPSEKVKKLIKSRPPVDWSIVEELMRKYGLRNATLLSIAPTGTISIIASTSSSIEPVFALAYARVVTVGTFIEVNKLFLDYLRRYGLDEPEVIKAIAEKGTIADNPFIPKPLRRLFRTAHDIEPKWHVLHQAVWQQWVDAGVSKTVNMRYEASVRDVEEVYLLAWKLGCKGITIYRDRSKARQVIHFGIKMAKKMLKEGVREEVVSEAEEEVEGEVSIGNQIVRGSSGTSAKRLGMKYRIARFSLPEGTIGDCKRCEY